MDYQLRAKYNIANKNPTKNKTGLKKSLINFSSGKTKCIIYKN